MALGKRCSSRGNERLGLGGVRSWRSVGQKKVLVMNNMVVNSWVSVPVNKNCGENWGYVMEKSVIESLPQDLLIRILCGVEHDDLKSLLQVSKVISESVVIARNFHYAFRTPAKRLAFRNPVDIDKEGELDEEEAPNAPKQLRVPKSRFVGNKEEEWWPRRALFTEMESKI